MSIFVDIASHFEDGKNKVLGKELNRILCLFSIKKPGYFNICCVFTKVFFIEFFGQGRVVCFHLDFGSMFFHTAPVHYFEI